MSNCIILTGGTYTQDFQAKIQRSLGPYRLATTLEKAGYTTKVIDYIIHFSYEELTAVLEQHLDEDTLWVGFSSTFFWANNSTSFYQTEVDRMWYTDVKEVHKIIDFIRSKSKAKIVYGGAKAPYFLADDQIDYYIIGYGDNSIVALSDHLKDGTPLLDCTPHVINDTTTYIIDSNKYPEPKMDQVQTEWWRKDFDILPGEGLPIEMARGCIFKCKFCSYPLLGKSKGTYIRDPNEIKDELIKTWEAHGTDSYYFTDDTFNDDNDKIEALHKVFTSLPFKPKFSAYLRIDLINKYPHQADMLTEMGLIGTYFGIETLQAQSAIAIGKGLAPNKVKDRLYWLNEKWANKVNIGAGFILGLPYDTHKYFSDLINWSMQQDNPIQHISYYPLFLFRRSIEEYERLAAYSSEFSLNPEIYGYKFSTSNPMAWELPEQQLSYELCTKIADDFMKIRSPSNKVSEFQMISNLNTGVSLEDLYKLTETQIRIKYNIAELNRAKIDQYKRLISRTG